VYKASEHATKNISKINVLQKRIKKLFLFLVFTLVLFFTCSCATKISEQNHNAAEINSRLGLYYLSKGNMDSAKEKLLTALKDDPKSVTANDSMAYFLEITNDPKNAEKYYLNAIKIAENKGAACNNYGTFLYRQHRFSEALQYFTLAINDPTYVSSEKAKENARLITN
jgi:type IV pilus assembly protein PilF